MNSKIYDCLIVGGGHAGIEAALAAARMGCKTLLLSMCFDTIGQMSCNPAIGGIGKGQLVKEIDALGGEMAHATDKCGIQFRTLNASKGPAVWSSRAQVDRKKYRLYMQNILTKQKKLKIIEGDPTSLLLKDNTVKGVEIDNKRKLYATTVIITPGTFLNGILHIGMKSFTGGRLEERKSSHGLCKTLKEIGFNLKRFSTCTSARLDGKTINFKGLKAQEGDRPPKPFSLSTGKINGRQEPCHLTYTNEKTHEVIHKNIDSCPLFRGKIEGLSVRYCPSFEEKVVRFPHHKRHQIFLEPEGLTTDTYYPNGIFTNMSEEVQDEFIHTIPGLEHVKVNRYGYGVEYDAVDATQLYPTLESKLVKNLYLGGQINGTTGYEEAGAQGLITGINAALRVKKKNPLILDRSTSYIGVLIDDLVTKGTNEPYRMFTSRVEYRLLIREDNTGTRLIKIGYKLGLVSKKNYMLTKRKQKKIEEGITYLRNIKIRPDKKTNKALKRLGSNPLVKTVTLEELLKRPEIKLEKLKKTFKLNLLNNIIHPIEIEIKYSDFIKRQINEVARFKNIENIKIPENFNYSELPSLSAEVREKLIKNNPISLGQASRISGITPTSISLLMIYLKKTSG